MDIEGILARLKGILVQTGDPPTSHHHPQGWEQKTESNSQGLNHLHSLCKDLCKDRAQPRNLPLYLPTPTKFPPKLSNSRLRCFYTPRHRPSRFGLTPPPPIRRSLHGLFALEVFALSPLFPRPPGFVRFSGYILLSVCLCALAPSCTTLQVNGSGTPLGRPLPM